MFLSSITKKEKIFFGILFLLTFLIYGQSLWGNFVFDDRGIKEHEALLSSIDNVFQVAAFPYWTVDAGLYRPVTLLSYSFNIVFLGPDAWGFHLVNLLIYFGICVGIYLLIKRVFKDEWLAYLSALLFLVLPIHTEVVANITGRSELLALFFSLLTLLEFTRARANPWRTGLWALLAIGAKETAIAVIPLVLLILAIRESGVSLRVFKKYFIELSGLLIGALLYFFFRFFVLGTGHFIGVETSIIENPLLFTSAAERIATALGILWMYISKSLWPTNLCSDYSFNQLPIVSSFLNLSTILGAVILVGSLITTIVFIKRRPLISFASALFFFSFLPVSNILFPIGTIAGERLFFFPSLGLVIIVALLLKKLVTLPTSRNTIIASLVALGLIIGVYGAASFKRQEDWLTEERLFLSAVECSPNSVLSRSNAGAAYLFMGELDKAAEQLEISRAIKSVYSKGLNNLGLVYWKQGKNREAEQMYYESLKQKYPYHGAIENLVLLYLSEGDLESAERWLRVMYPNSEEMVKKTIKGYQGQ